MTSCHVDKNPCPLEGTYGYLPRPSLLKKIPLIRAPRDLYERHKGKMTFTTEVGQIETSLMSFEKNLM